MIEIRTPDNRRAYKTMIKCFDKEEDGFTDEIVAYIKRHKHHIERIEGSGWTYYDDEMTYFLGLLKNKKDLYEDIYNRIKKDSMFRTEESKNKTLEIYRKLIEKELRGE